WRPRSSSTTCARRWKSSRGCTARVPIHGRRSGLPRVLEAAMPRAWAGLVLLCVLTAGCTAAAAVRPSAYPDSDVPCPGALKQWNLRVLDRRAETTSSEKVFSTVSGAIRQSFPGCHWTSDEGVPSIEIEIHNFESVKNGDVWDAHVQWNVTAA